MRTSLGAFRLFHIVVVIVRHSVTHMLTRPGTPVQSIACRLGIVSVPGPVRLRRTLEDLGGSFVKFGQMLALQPDILPLDYCNALFTLLDRVSPFGYEYVQRTFEDEFGKSPEEIFDTFDRRPLATASVGQVHLATLGGRMLAVKVRRPNVEQDFLGDIRLITALTSTIERLRIRSMHWLVEPMREFVDWTREELDYRIEARYMQRLRENAEGRPVERIPEVLWAYTSRRTLVAEFLEGHTLLACLRAREAPGSAEARRIAQTDIDPHRVAANIIDNFVRAVFRHGMFHADLHPANLLVLRDNAIGYIDFGITGVISAYSRRSLVALTLAYTSADLDAMAHAFFRVCRMTDDDSPAEFRRGLHALESSWYECRGTRRTLRKNFTLVMLDMLHLSRRCGVWPDRDVIKYIRSAIAIDGLITRMAPGFDTTDYLATVCAQHLRSQMRGTLLTYEAFTDVAAAGGRLMRTGMVRWATAIGRVVDGSLPSRVGEISPRPRRPSGPRHLKALSLGGVAVAAVVLVHQAEHGAPMVPAAVAVVALASILLAWLSKRNARCIQAGDARRRA